MTFGNYYSIVIPIMVFWEFLILSCHLREHVDVGGSSQFRFMQRRQLRQKLQLNQIAAPKIGLMSFEKGSKLK